MFPGWETIPDGLAAIGWQGDTSALREALAPWRETEKIAVNIDLGENGVLPKIGVEVFSRWRHPLLVDMFITRLEAAGLCLPSKAEALRRWIRIRPDGAPFIQTLIAYFKLNYRDGNIVEAKAYLEQSPYIRHHYFDAYERPVYVDFAVKDGTGSLPVDEALKHLGACLAPGAISSRPIARHAPTCAAASPARRWQCPAPWRRGNQRRLNDCAG